MPLRLKLLSCGPSHQQIRGSLDVSLLSILTIVIEASYTALVAHESLRLLIPSVDHLYTILVFLIVFHGQLMFCVVPIAYAL